MTDEEFKAHTGALVEQAGGTDAFLVQIGWDLEKYREIWKLLPGYKSGGGAT